jgi:hypothetical protein
MSYSRPRRPTELPELRAKLLDDRAFWRAMADLGTLNPSFERADLMRDSLARATLWWIGTDCCDLLDQAAPAMPPVTLTAELVPDIDGLAFLERPLTGIDALHPDVAVPFDYIHWEPSIVRDLACLSIVVWRHFSDQSRVPPAPLGRTDWPYGFSTDHRLPGVSDLAHRSMVEDRRLLAALWQFSSQPSVTTSRDVNVDWAATKRLARQGHEPAPVRLVNLNRRHKRQPAPGSPRGPREYSCQWIVKPHWRQQAYGPGRALRKAIYIERFVKGPSDKPLRVRDTVKVWDQPDPGPQP